MTKPGSSLSVRLSWLFVAYFAGFAVMVAVAVPSLLAAHDQLDRLQHTIAPARVADQTLDQALVDQETGERGYIITDDDTFLRPYRSGQQQVAAQLRALDRLNLPGLAPLLVSLDKADQAWQRQAELEIDAERSNNHDEAVKLVRGGVGRTRFAISRQRLKAVDAMVNTDANAFRDELRSSLTLLAVVLSLSLAGLVAMTVAGLVLVRRWIVAPLGQLVDAVGTVRDGQLFHPMPELDSKELAELADSVDAMRVEILDQLSEAIHSREALEQEGPMVLQLREDLAPDPVEIPAGLRVLARVEPAEGFLAGDFYDLRVFDDGRLGLVVVDVAGHGARPGVLAAQIKHLMSAAWSVEPLDPAAALSWMAARLGDTGDLFATAAVVTVDPRTGRLRVANAAHPAVLVVSRGELRRIGPTGPLIGPFVGSWSVVDLDLGPDDMVVLSTDGLVEARGPSGQEFGQERLEQLLVAHPDADAIMEAMAAELGSFRGERLDDDLTIAIIERYPVPDDPTPGDLTEPDPAP
jgi:serine phosphatase RsbU (regulator of sigma subunit)/CHASE3 domain sensor protein